MPSRRPEPAQRERSGLGARHDTGLVGRLALGPPLLARRRRADGARGGAGGRNAGAARAATASAEADAGGFDDRPACGCRGGRENEGSPKRGENNG